MTFGWITGNAGVAGHQYQSSQSIDSGHFSQPGVLDPGLLKVRSYLLVPPVPCGVRASLVTRDTKVPCLRYGIV